jgi:hypothetical protein
VEQRGFPCITLNLVQDCSGGYPFDVKCADILLLTKQCVAQLSKCVTVSSPASNALATSMSPVQLLTNAVAVSSSVGGVSAPRGEVAGSLLAGSWNRTRLWGEGWWRVLLPAGVLFNSLAGAFMVASNPSLRLSAVLACAVAAGELLQVGLLCSGVSLSSRCGRCFLRAER